jgi:hypothetical protein
MDSGPAALEVTMNMFSSHSDPIEADVKGLLERDGIAAEVRGEAFVLKTIGRSTPVKGRRHLESGQTNIQDPDLRGLASHFYGIAVTRPVADRRCHEVR